MGDKSVFSFFLFCDSDFLIVSIVVQMLLAILACCTAEELGESSEEEEGDGQGRARDADALVGVGARRQAIKNKILAAGRMRRVFQILRFVFSFKFTFNNSTTKTCLLFR